MYKYGIPTKYEDFKFNFKPSTKEAYEAQFKPKKDWEVTSLINNTTSLILYYNSEGECIKRSDNGHIYTISLSLKQGLENIYNNWSIHSVKRLSDGVEFKIGDNVSFNSPKSKITNFRIEFYGMMCDLDVEFREYIKKIANAKK